MVTMDERSSSMTWHFLNFLNALCGMSSWDVFSDLTEKV